MNCFYSRKYFSALFLSVAMIMCIFMIASNSESRRLEIELDNSTFEIDNGTSQQEQFFETKLFIDELDNENKACFVYPVNCDDVTYCWIYYCTSYPKWELADIIKINTDDSYDVMKSQSYQDPNSIFFPDVKFEDTLLYKVVFYCGDPDASTRDFDKDGLPDLFEYERAGYDPFKQENFDVKDEQGYSFYEKYILDYTIKDKDNDRDSTKDYEEIIRLTDEFVIHTSSHQVSLCAAASNGETFLVVWSDDSGVFGQYLNTQGLLDNEGDIVDFNSTINVASLDIKQLTGFETVTNLIVASDGKKYLTAYEYGQASFIVSVIDISDSCEEILSLPVKDSLDTPSSSKILEYASNGSSYFLGLGKRLLENPQYPENTNAILIPSDNTHDFRYISIDTIMTDPSLSIASLGDNYLMGYNNQNNQFQIHLLDSEGDPLSVFDNEGSIGSTKELFPRMDSYKTIASSNQISYSFLFLDKDTSSKDTSSKDTSSKDTSSIEFQNHMYTQQIQEVKFDKLCFNYHIIAGGKYPYAVATNGLFYLLVWKENGVSKLYAQLYNTKMIPLYKPFEVGEINLLTSLDREYAVVSDGKDFLVVWFEEEEEPDSHKWILKGRFLCGIASSPSKNDTDNDGLSDYDEIHREPYLPTDPTNSDTDLDGISDCIEIMGSQTDPRNPDTDNDGLWDAFDPDPTNNDIDNDGLLDGYEIYVSHSDPSVADTDNDGLLDGEEITYGFDPNDWDSDDDGQSDYKETIEGTVYTCGGETCFIYTDALNPDTDNDGIMDGAELAADYIPEFTVSDLLQSNINSTVAFYDPYVSIGSNGNTYLLVWSEQHDLDETSEIKQWDIMGQIINIDGSRTTDPFFLQTYYYKEPRDVAIGSNGNSYILIWPDYDGVNDEVVLPETDNDSPWYTQLSTFHLGIYGQIIKSNGELVGSRFLVNSYTPNNQQQPAVASIGNNYLITWQSRVNDSLLEEIKGQFVSADGRKIGDEFQINTTTSGQQGNPAVASCGNNYLVAWEDRSSGYRIKGQFLNNDGNKLGNEFEINDTSHSNNLIPAVAAVDETFIVTWHSIDNGYDIAARLITYTATGHSFLSYQFQVNQYTTSDQTVADVASDGARFLVSWASVGQGGTAEDIFARWVNPSGNLVPADEFQVNIYTDDREYRSQVASNGFNFCITWASMNTNDTTARVYGAVYRTKDGINPISGDSDNDGLPDAWEIDNFTNPLDNSDAWIDMDNDGLTNWQEFQAGTDPRNQDTDHDGLPDNEGLVTLTSPLLFDTDNDGISDYDELYLYNTEPLVSDTDNDGLTDIDEIKGLFVSEFRVPSTATNAQHDPRIATDGSNYCVVWQEQLSTSTQQVKYKLYNNHGIPVTPDFSLSNYTFSDSLYADVCSDGSRYLIVYSDYDNDDTGLFGQIIDNEGNLIDSSFKINSYTTTQQIRPSIAFDGTNYLVCWQSGYGQDGSNFGIYGRLFDTNGIPLEDEDIKINSTTVKDQIAVQTIWNGSYFVVTWDDRSSAWEVKAQLVNSAGALVGDEITVNSYFIDWQLGSTSYSNGSNTLSTWYSRTQDGDAGGIFAQLFNNDGGKIGSEFRINTQASGDQFASSVASTSDGYFVVWSSEQTGGESYDIIARYLTPDGMRIGPEFFVNHYTTGRQVMPRTLSNGTNFLVVWEDNNQDGDDYGIYAALFDQNNSTDPNNPDTDNDGLLDGWERLYGLNPIISQSANHDSDNDGLTDQEEYIHGTDPFNIDSDNDGIADGDEVDIYGTYPDDNDSDYDLLVDGAEILSHGTDPLDNDSDDDLLGDGDEILVYGTDPLDNDSDNDGLTDGEEVLPNIVKEILISDQNKARLPFVGSDGHGYMISWSEEASYGNYEVYGQRLTSAGEKIDTPFLIGTYSFSEHRFVDVESNGSNYMVIWPDQDGDSLGVYGSILDNEGSTLVPTFQINTYTTNIQMVVAMKSDGVNYLVTWQSGYGQDGSRYGIYGQLISDQGMKINSEFQINECTSRDQIYPEVAFNGATYFVVWENRAGVLNPWELSGKIYDRFGTPLSGEFQLNTTTPDWQLLPSIASNGNDFLTVWHDTSSGRYNITAQLFDSDGNKIGGERILNTLSGDPEYLNGMASAVASNGLDYFVVWSNSSDYDGDGYTVFGQRIKADGAKMGTEFQINVHTESNQMNPQITTDGKGYAVVWDSQHSDGSGSSVYAAIYDWGYGTDPLDNDSDNDGLTDGEEMNTYGTNPMHPDSDFDGLLDSDEIAGLSNPRLPDSDYDGLSDGLELNAYNTDPLNVDSDNDDLSDGAEVYNYITDPLNTDSDNDGLTDGDEVQIYGSNPLVDDSDNDGLTDDDEVYIYNTNPALSDTDFDGIEDAVEIVGPTDPLVSDTDNDGLLDGSEVYDYNTDPLDEDSDDDGLTDGAEVDPIVQEILIADQHKARLPFVASNGNGYLMAWSEEVSSSNYEVYCQRLTSNGVKIASPFLIGTYSFSEHRFVDVESNGSNYMVIWPDQDGSDLGVYGVILNNEGSTVVPKFQINSYTSNRQMTIAMTTDGENYLVTWQSQGGQDGSMYGIYGQLISSEGTKINGEFQINECTARDQIYPEVACNGTSYFVVWENRAGVLNPWELSGKMYDRSGTPLSGEFQLNTTTPDWQLLPSIASNGNDFLTVWHDTSSGRYNITAQLFDSDGSKIGGERILNTLNGDPEYLNGMASATASNGLDYFVVWSNSSDYDGDGYTVFGQRLETDGAKIGTEFQINLHTESNQMNPQVSTDGKGYAIVWDSEHADNSGSSIYAAVYNWQTRTNPLNNDSDNDGLTDGDEVLIYGTSPVDSDSDEDRLTDGEEVTIGTDPLNSDSDNDGFSDSEEYLANTDPLSDQSIPQYIVLTLNNEGYNQGGQDTWLASNHPNNIYGNDNEITVASNNHESAQQLLYIQFEIPNNPAGKTIAYAELQLYLFANMNSTDTDTVYVHTILQQWNEMSVTYETRPPVSINPYSFAEISRQNKWIKIDVTNAVSEWMDQGTTNYGVQLNMTAPSTVDNRKRFLSKENSSNRPRLRIIYR